MALMAEVNAEIHEEVIVDDERSVDGSLPESEDPGFILHVHIFNDSLR